MKVDRNNMVRADGRDVTTAELSEASPAGVERTRASQAGGSRAVLGAWLRDIGNRLLHWSRTAEGRALLILLGVALLVRLPLLPYHGFFHDPQFYVQWGVSIDHDLLHFYDSPLIPNYTPLTPYLDGLLWLIYVAVAHLLGQPPIADTFHSPLLVSIIKLPGLFAELALTAVIYHVVRPVVTHRWALIAAAIYAFSPAILFVGVLYGQTDSTYTLFLILALVTTYRQQPIRSGVFFALAFMLKPTPIFLLPLLAVALMRYAGWRAVARFGGAFAAVAAVLWAPFLLPPHPEILRWIHNIQTFNKPYASYNAENFWWALGQRAHSSLTPIYAGLTPNQIGLGVFAVVLLASALAVWRNTSLGTLLFASATVSLTFFEITTAQHERFVYPALVLFLVAAAYQYRRASLVFYVCFSGLMLLNTIANIALQYPTSIDDIDLSYWHGLLMYTHPKVLRLLAAGGVALWLVALALLACGLAVALAPRATQSLLAALRLIPAQLARQSAALVKSRR